MKYLLNALLLLLLATAGGDTLYGKEAPEKTELPRVLLIGDSISIGYTKPVIKALEGRAVVRHHKGNAGHTGMGLKNLDRWLGNTKWDVIHFNWGLWDLCYRHPDSRVQGKRDKVNGTVTHTIEQYEKNLEQLVIRLKKTGARLIWAHTTVVPEKEAGRVVGDDRKYNEAAARIMKKHAIPINDLNTLSRSFSPDLFVKPGDVHYKAEGSRKLGKQVAAKIMAVLGADEQQGSGAGREAPVQEGGSATGEEGSQPADTARDL